MEENSPPQSNHKTSQDDPDIPLEQTPPKGDNSNNSIRNIDTVQIPEIIEEEAAGGNENSKPDAASTSDEGKQEVNTKITDSSSPP